MAILWAGGEMGAVAPSESSIKESTAAGTFSPAFSRCSIEVPGGSNQVPDNAWVESPALSPRTSLYVHGLVANYRALLGHTVLELVDAVGTGIIRMRWEDGEVAGGAFLLQYKNSANAWVRAGTPAEISSALTEIDLFFDLAAGTLSLFIAGTRRISVTGLDLSHLSGVTQARFRSSLQPSNWSQLVIADEPTIGGRLFTIPITGAGAQSEWAGDYTAIDEVVYSDADLIASTAANQVSTFGVTAPNLTGYRVKAVVVAARAKRGASGPQNLQLALRVGSTVYVSGPQPLDVALGSHVGVWENNPATSAAWGNLAVATLQPGVKSLA